MKQQTTIAIGQSVVVKRPKEPNENKRFNGRKGTVVRLNKNSRPESDTGLWYVKLHETDKAKESIELFWGHQLERIDPP